MVGEVSYLYDTFACESPMNLLTSLTLDFAHTLDSLLYLTPSLPLTRQPCLQNGTLSRVAPQLAPTFRIRNATVRRARR